MIDDISPLRALSASRMAAKLHVFAPRAAIQHGVSQTPSTRFPGQGEFRGETTRSGVMLQLVVNAPELKHPDPDAEEVAAPEDREASETDEEGEESADDTPKDKVTIEVRDADGALVRTFRAGAHLGINRVYWRFERDGVQGPSKDVTEAPELPPAGRQVLPGNYRVTVRFQGEEQTVDAQVLPDPRVQVARADHEAKDALRAPRP